MSGETDTEAKATPREDRREPTGCEEAVKQKEMDDRINRHLRAARINLFKAAELTSSTHHSTKLYLISKAIYELDDALI